MADVPVVEPATTGEGPDRSILDRVLHQTGTSPTPVQAGEDECPNCANNGKSVTLVNFVCPNCGYEQPVQTRPTQLNQTKEAK